MSTDTYDNEMLCKDCAMYVINRDSSGADDDWDKQSLQKSTEDFLLFATGEEEDFSTTPCWGCGTFLAGHRHEFSVEKM